MDVVSNLVKFPPGTKALVVLPRETFTRPSRASDRLILPAINDWSRVPRILSGELPMPWPPIVSFSSEAGIEALRGMYRANVPIVIDNEWDIETKKIYQTGFYVDGIPVVIWDAAEKGAVPFEKVMDIVDVFLATRTVVLQNAPADLVAWKRVGDTAKRIDDTVYMHAARWPELKHNLDFITSLYGKHVRVKHVGAGSHEYLRGDVVETWNCYAALRKELESDERSANVYEKFLRPLVPIITDVHTRGLRVNTPFVEAKYADYTARVENAERLAHAYVGYPINLDSSPQLRGVLLAEGALRSTKKTKSGALSLDKDVVAALRDSFLPRAEDEDVTIENVMSRIERGAHPLVEARAFHVEARHRRSSYVLPCLGRDRIYPEFLPFAQTTGRWSVIHPPLAQLPDDLYGIVCPDVGESWLRHDWKGIEGRIMAFESGDVALREAFDKGYDVHTINVCDLFEYPYPADLVKPENDASWCAAVAWTGGHDVRRTYAKRFMFRLFYGGSPYAAHTIPGSDLLNVYGITKERLIKASLTWLRKHPAITRYWRRLEKEYLVDRTLRTALGRRRVFFASDTAKAIREVKDFPMQGGVADVLNKTVIDLWNASRARGGRLVLTVHDSVWWGIATEHASAFVDEWRAIIEQPWNWRGETVTFPADYAPILTNAERSDE